MSLENSRILDAYERANHSLLCSVSMFPLPALISVGLSLLFTGHLLLGVNQRLGHRASVASLSASLQSEGAVWFSVIRTSSGGMMMVSSDREMFEFTGGLQMQQDRVNAQKLDAYLEKVKRNLFLSSVLAKNATRTQTKVVLAVDETIKYGQIKPIVAALVGAGFANYGFEVKRPISR